MTTQHTTPQPEQRKTIEQFIYNNRHYLSDRGIPDYLRDIVTVKDCAVIMQAYADQEVAHSRPSEAVSYTLRWVRVCDNIPDSDKEIVCRKVGLPDRYFVVHREGVKLRDEDGDLLAYTTDPDFEYLVESSTLTEQGIGREEKEGDAVAFADWVYVNYVRAISGWVLKYADIRYGKTTAELYTLFLNREK